MWMLAPLKYKLGSGSLILSKSVTIYGFPRSIYHIESYFGEECLKRSHTGALGLVWSAQSEEPQRFDQRLVKVVMVHHIRPQNDIIIPPNAFHFLPVPPRQGRHVDCTSADPQDSSIGVDIELQVRQHVGEVRDGDTSSEQCSRGDPDEPGARAQLEEAQGAAGFGEQGGERSGLAVEEGDEGGGGGPELEGDAFGGDLADGYGGVDGVELVAFFLTLCMVLLVVVDGFFRWHWLGHCRRGRFHRRRIRVLTSSRILIL